MKFKVGDRVKVINWGQSYSNTVNWLVDNEDIPRSLIARYAFGDDSKFRNCRFNDADIYTVEYLKDGKALISSGTEGIYTCIYIINVDALVQVEVKKMTVSEIEEMLGYKVEIIAENQN